MSATAVEDPVGASAIGLWVALMWVLGVFVALPVHALGDGAGRLYELALDHAMLDVRIVGP